MMDRLSATRNLIAMGSGPQRYVCFHERFRLCWSFDILTCVDPEGKQNFYLFPKLCSPRLDRCRSPVFGHDRLLDAFKSLKTMEKKLKEV